MKLGKIGELSKCRGQGAGSRGQESSRLPSLEGLGVGKKGLCSFAVLQLFKF